MAYIAFLPKPHHLPTYEFDSDSADDSEVPVERATWYLALHGLRIPPERFPKKAILKSSHKITQDIICVWVTNWTVSCRTKKILESVAPKQVEFIPVEIVRSRDGNPVNDFNYFYTNILNRINTVDLTASNLTVNGVHPRTGGVEVDWPEGGRWTQLKIKIDKRPHPGVHIWHESDLGRFGEWVFVSNELAHAFKAANIEKLIYVHAEE